MHILVRVLVKTTNYKPFLKVQLCLHDAQLRDLVWNPVVVEMYIYIMSDGSVHIHQVAEAMLKIVASKENVNATAVCWSKDGEQVVLGINKGNIVVLTATLQELKNVAPPNVDIQRSSVACISWISKSLFAVLYVSEHCKTDVPYLVFVSTDSSVAYSSYSDIYFGSCFDQEKRYFMHFELNGEVLLIGSTCSPFLIVVGRSHSNPCIWEQLDLKEGAEVMLPTDEFDEETYPIGIGIMYCGQKNTLIKNNAAMPVICILSTKGLLMTYQMCNAAMFGTDLHDPTQPRIKEDAISTTKYLPSPSEISCTSCPLSQEHDKVNIKKIKLNSSMDESSSEATLELEPVLYSASFIQKEAEIDKSSFFYLIVTTQVFLNYLPLLKLLMRSTLDNRDILIYVPMVILNDLNIMKTNKHTKRIAQMGNKNIVHFLRHVDNRFYCESSADASKFNFDNNPYRNSYMGLKAKLFKVAILAEDKDTMFQLCSNDIEIFSVSEIKKYIKNDSDVMK